PASRLASTWLWDPVGQQRGHLVDLLPLPTSRRCHKHAASCARGRRCSGQAPPQRADGPGLEEAVTAQLPSPEDAVPGPRQEGPQATWDQFGLRDGTQAGRHLSHRHARPCPCRQRKTNRGEH
uniref:Uncharacterized protein n=1 Tax=Anser brachyrhynchus TaxID=132585 RepID=A0A8B9BWG9_9AVES